MRASVTIARRSVDTEKLEPQGIEPCPELWLNPSLNGLNKAPCTPRIQLGPGAGILDHRMASVKSRSKMSIPFVYTAPQKKGEIRSKMAKRHFTKTRMNTGFDHIWRRLEKPEKVPQTLCHLRHVRGALTLSLLHTAFEPILRRLSAGRHFKARKMAHVRVVGNHSGPVGPFNVGLGPLSARCHAQDFTSQLRICSRLGGYYGYLLYPTSATIELWLVMCLSN